MKMNKSNEAQFEHDGLLYKKGIHNLVFMLIDNKWTKSSKQWSEVVRGKAVRR